MLLAHMLHKLIWAKRLKDNFGIHELVHEITPTDKSPFINEYLNEQVEKDGYETVHWDKVHGRRNDT